MSYVQIMFNDKIQTIIKEVVRVQNDNKELIKRK